MAKLLIALITALAFVFVVGCPKEDQKMPDASVAEPKEETKVDKKEVKDEKKEEKKEAKEAAKDEKKEEPKVSPPEQK